MAELTSTNNRRIISSNWGVWIAIIVIIAVIALLIYWIWRFFAHTTQVVQERVPATVAAKQSSVRFISTPTEVIVDDDPVIPEGETSVEAIAKNFPEYQGHPVVVSGSVVDYQSSTYFSVSQGDYQIVVMGFDGVTTKNGLTSVTNPKNQYVRVTGTVKLLTKDEDKTGFGFQFRDLNDALWQDKMIIEATSIEVITPSTI